MGCCNILSQGEKIRLLRKKYNLKQEEIAGSDITRNLISEIETNKANLTRNAAEAVLKNVQVIADRRHFQVDETVEYLLETETEQASKILDKYINELKTVTVYKDNSFLDMLKEAEGFLIKWDLIDKKIAIYELAGDYFCMQNELNKSIVYYEKALAVIGKLFPTEELLNILHKLCRTYGNAGRYDESIGCCDFALDHFEDLSEKDIVYFVYNRAFTFVNLRNFERALAGIDKIEGMIDKDDAQRYFTILDTKAVCLYELKRYDEALKVYTKLLKTLDDKQIDKKIVMHINIAEIYIVLCETDKANVLLNQINKELPFINNSSCYKANIYYELGKIYKGYNDKVKAVGYYLKALEISKKQNDCVLIADILYELMDCENNSEKINSIKNEVFVILSKQNKLADKLVHKLINFYAINNDISKVVEINNFALQFV